MENQASFLGTLLEKTKHYVMTTAELYKLKAIDKSADLISALAARIVIFLFLVLFFLTLNVGIILWIGETMGRAYYGFFIVAGFYALIAIVFYAFRDKWIKRQFRNVIVKQLLN